jgi:glycosyltransferase involved in cell wall biosynthesis
MTVSDMSISVALATFNGDRFLRRQLTSLADQTLKPSELVVTDDGSSDDTLEILLRFAKVAPFPVRVMQNESRLGYRANFMKAAELCTSDLIAFCDQDDVWEPNKLQIMQEVFGDPKVLLAFHSATLINNAEVKIGRVFSNGKANIRYKPLGIRSSMIVPGFAQVVRRSLVRFTPLHSESTDPYHPNHRMPHDLWYPFWASVFGHVIHVPKPLARYRQHGGNTSGWIQDWSAAYVLDHIRNAEFYARSHAIGMGNRLHLLRRSRHLLVGDEVESVNAAIAHFKALALRSDHRWAVYKATTLMERARTLASLVRNGGYTGDRSKSLGLDTLLLDAFIGVPFGHIYRAR